MAMIALEIKFYGTTSYMQSISDQVIVMSHRPFRLIWKR